jgi:uncharacterized protein (TIGR03000 family)
MPRFRFLTSVAFTLSILLWGMNPAAHGHGGGHGGGGHGGGGHGGIGYGGYHHGFGYGGFSGFHGFGYRGFGFSGFGYPGFGFSGFSGFGFSGFGFGFSGLGGLGFGGLGFSGLGFSGLGFSGFGYGGLGFGGLGYGGLGYGGYGYGGYGGFYPAGNGGCLNAYPVYGGYSPGYGGGAPPTDGSTPLPMPNSVSSASRYVDYYARNTSQTTQSVTVSNTAPTRYADYYARNATPAANNKARLHVTLPADAELWLNGKRTHRNGVERDFITPQLKQGQTYAYQVKARWTQDGKPLEETVEVKVRANKTTNVTLGSSSLAQR